MSVYTSWNERPEVVQNLFNPPFCGLLLWEAIRGYNDTGMDFALSYIVLPIILHSKIRHSLPSTTRKTFTTWIMEHPEHAITLPELINTMRPFSADGLLWAANGGVIRISDVDAKITATRDVPRPNSIGDDLILEVSHCVHKSLFLGKWLAKSGSTSVIFGLLGIRP